MTLSSKSGGEAKPASPDTSTAAGTTVPAPPCRGSLWHKWLCLLPGSGKMQSESRRWCCSALQQGSCARCAVRQGCHGQLVLCSGDRSNASACLLLCLAHVITHCSQPFTAATALSLGPVCNCGAAWSGQAKSVLGTQENCHSECPVLGRKCKHKPPGNTRSQALTRLKPRAEGGV